MVIYKGFYDIDESCRQFVHLVKYEQRPLTVSDNLSHLVDQLQLQTGRLNILINDNKNICIELNVTGRFNTEVNI